MYTDILMDLGLFLESYGAVAMYNTIFCMSNNRLRFQQRDYNLDLCSDRVSPNSESGNATKAPNCLGVRVCECCANKTKDIIYGNNVNRTSE
jgi:hypothetical protein